MAVSQKNGGMFAEINVTPLTDVFLILVVILILLMPLLNRAALKVEMPNHTGAAPASREKVIEVHVNAQGEVKVNDNVVSSDCLSIETALRSEQAVTGKKDIPVRLSFSQECRHKSVVAVVDAAQGAGITRLQLAPEDN